MGLMPLFFSGYQMTPELITAVTGLVTGAVGVYIALRNARKDEIERLWDRIAEIEQKYERKIALLDEQYERESRNKRKLLEYIAQLRCIMIAAGLSVPEMPALED